MTRRRLSGKQQAFVEAYIASNFNATQAARMAGYGGGEDSFKVIGSKNLTNANIRASIDRRLKASKMGADEVLARISFIAAGSLEDFLTGEDLTSFDLTQAKRAEKLGLIKKIKITKNILVSGDMPVLSQTIEFELHDAMRALEMLGKHHKVFDRSAESNWLEEAIKAGIKDPERVADSLADEFVQHMKKDEPSVTAD